MQRIRIAYNKGTELQYTGNLDMHKVWERTFRRAQLPLAYSQGFHPQPKLQQAAPLPLGFTSQAEILDVWFDTDEPITDIARKIIVTVQPGIQVRHVESMPLLSEPLPNLVAAADYSVTCDEKLEPAEVQKSIDALLIKEQIIRVRRGKNYNLRPLVQSLALAQELPLCLTMRLSCLPSATGRPEEVLEELGIDPYSVDINRTLLILKKQ